MPMKDLRKPISPSSRPCWTRRIRATRAEAPSTLAPATRLLLRIPLLHLSPNFLENVRGPAFQTKRFGHLEHGTENVLPTKSMRRVRLATGTYAVQLQ